MYAKWVNFQVLGWVIIALMLTILSSQVRVTTSMRLQNGRQVHVRSSTNAEPEQKKIYQVLNLPNRPGKTVKTFV